MSLLKEERKNILNKRVENALTARVVLFCNANFSTDNGFSYSLLRHSEGFSPKSLSFQWKVENEKWKINIVVANFSTIQLLNPSDKDRLEGVICSL